MITPAQSSLVSPTEATLIVGLATLFGSFIGSITQFAISRLKSREEVDSLRQSLLAELQALPPIEHEAWTTLAAHDQPDEMIPATVYLSNSDKIGHLTPEESKSVVKFYSRLTAYKSLAKNSSGFEGDDVKESVEELLTDLENWRSDAIEELEKNVEHD